MEPVAGAMLAPFLVGGAAYGNHLTSTYGKSANQISAGVQAFCWILQFIGHGKFEGRAPALLDNLVQAFFLAPFFVFLEVLFMLGYRPELKSRLDKHVEIELEKLNGKKAATNGSANGKAK